MPRQEEDGMQCALWQRRCARDVDIALMTATTMRAACCQAARKMSPRCHVLRARMPRVAAYAPAARRQRATVTRRRRPPLPVVRKFFFFWCAARLRRNVFLRESVRYRAGV